MNVKDFEKKEKSTGELTVEVTAEEFEKAINAAYIKNRGRLNIPGFRKGKAPRKIIEKMYGESVFYDDAIEEVYPSALTLGVTEKQLSVVGTPAISDLSVGEDKSVTIKFLVSLYPEIVVEGYKGIAAPKPAVEVTDKDVEREIERTRESNARIETVDREAKNGDIATIDFEGFIDGVAFDGGKGEDYDLELGSGTFIPGFEEQLVGKKEGDDVDVNVTFPDAYAPELAGKDATFKVKVKTVKEKQLPELDDEFAKDVSEFDTYAEYFNSVREELSEKRKKEADDAYESVVLSRLVEKVEGEIPEAMIDEQVENRIQNFRYNLMSQGMELESYLSMLGMDLETMKNEIRPTALQEIKNDLALEAIAKAEQFEVTDERIEEEYKTLAETYSMEVDAVKKAISADSVKTGIMLDMAKELVMSTAVVEEKTEEGEKAEQDAPAEE